MRSCKQRKVRWSERIGIQTKISIAIAAGSVYIMGMVFLVGYLNGQSMADAELLKEMARRLVAVFVAALIGGILVSRLIVRMLVGKPLLQLSHIAEKVAIGDFSNRLSIRSRDEIGTLALSFNTMTSHLGHLVQSILESSRSVMGIVSRIQGRLAMLHQGLDQTADAAGRLIETGERLSGKLKIAMDASSELVKTTGETWKGVQGLAEKMAGVHGTVQQCARASSQLNSDLEGISTGLYQAMERLNRWAEYGETLKLAAEEAVVLAEQVSLLTLSLYTGDENTPNTPLTGERLEEIFRLGDRAEIIARQVISRVDGWKTESEEIALVAKHELEDLAGWVARYRKIETLWQQAEQLAGDTLASINMIGENVEEQQVLVQAVQERVEQVFPEMVPWRESAPLVIACSEEERLALNDIRSNTIKLERTVSNLGILLSQFKLADEKPSHISEAEIEPKAMVTGRLVSSATLTRREVG